MTGRLLGATITCPDAGAAATLYVAALGYMRLDDGLISETEALLWQAPALAGATFVRIAPEGLDAPWLRFIAQPGVVPAPFTTSGWAALELVVEDCDAAVARLSEHGFRVLGQAADLDFSEGAIRAGQLLGPYGEMLYLTQVIRQVPGYNLPVATRFIDRLFIAILATASIEGSLSELSGLGIAENARFWSAVPFIAKAHGLPSAHEFTIATATLSTGAYLEVDDLPGLSARERLNGLLPPGIAFMTLAASDPGFIASHSGLHLELSAD
jgi:hypothetical protein